MNALEVIGIIALVVWVPSGILLTTLLVFERRVSPRLWADFLRWRHGNI
jgi:hypothetical protein